MILTLKLTKMKKITKTFFAVALAALVLFCFSLQSSNAVMLNNVEALTSNDDIYVPDGCSTITAWKWKGTSHDWEPRRYFAQNYQGTGGPCSYGQCYDIETGECFFFDID